MTTKETRNIKLKPGYVWKNIAQINETPNWVESVATHAEDDNKIFGYEPAVLMSKQYR